MSTEINRFLFSYVPTETPFPKRFLYYFIYIENLNKKGKVQKTKFKLDPTEIRGFKIVNVNMN